MFGRRKKERLTWEVTTPDGTTEEMAEDMEYMDARLFVRINTHGNPAPEKHGDGDWYDLATAEDVKMKKGDLRVISLGISIETPTGYTTYILPRSSTPKKHGIILANSMGVIDHSYRGDNDIIGFPAYAIRDTTIPKGTRIAQMAIYRSPEDIAWEETDCLGNDDRGGFGSTGV